MKYKLLLCREGWIKGADNDGYYNDVTGLLAKEESGWEELTSQEYILLYQYVVDYNRKNKGRSNEILLLIEQVEQPLRLLINDLIEKRKLEDEERDKKDAEEKAAREAKKEEKRKKKALKDLEKDKKRLDEAKKLLESQGLTVTKIDSERG